MIRYHIKPLNQNKMIIIIENQPVKKPKTSPNTPEEMGVKIPKQQKQWPKKKQDGYPL
jgi:hypothetical protein